MYKNLLVVVDLSSEAKLVLKKAMTMAEKNAQVLLVHVVEPLITESPYELAPLVSLDVEQQLVKRGESFLQSLVADLDAKHVKSQVLLGSVKGEILNFAQSNSVDLIVVGTHGRHGLGILLGSTANAILHGTPCDVLAVRVGE
ncbi:MAG: universal stress protein [Gammaproteobacteria bacterium]|nr:universal stress protein [Gammaproteobacteria bacterium]